MKLPPQSIGKLFREDFSGISPIAVNRGNLMSEAKSIRQKISKIPGVHVTRHPGDKDSRSKTLCRFTVPDPENADNYWRRDELRLEFNDDGFLTLNSYRYREQSHCALVSDFEEVRTFVRHVLERYARRHASAKKREKIRDFKSKAIIAQVKKLAGEQHFDYATVTDSVKLKLFVRLSERDMIEISVPFSRFEKVLPRLRTTIEALRDLYHEGLRFSVVPASRLPWNVQWVGHDGELDADAE